MQGAACPPGPPEPALLKMVLTGTWLVTPLVMVVVMVKMVLTVLIKAVTPEKFWNLVGLSHGLSHAPTGS